MTKPLKVGLIGTGGIARRHLAAYLEHPDRVQVTATCDIIESAAQAFAKQAGAKAIYTDYETMLREADIDAVDICTGHAQHAEPTVAAARAGKHVLVEKTMAHTLQGCRDMIDATDDAGVTLMIAQNQRYTLQSAAVKRLVDAGTLVDIQAVRTHVIMAGTEKPWMNDFNEGGRVLMLNTVHFVDLLRYYIGNVKRVTGIRKSVQSRMANGADDLVAATLEFENGAIGDVFGSWTTYLIPEASSYQLIGSKGTLYSTKAKERSAKSAGYGTMMYGTKVDDPDMEMIMNPPFQALATDDTGLPTDDCFANEVLHFAECCQSGQEPISNGRDNIETVKILFGIYESSRTGTAVDLATL